LKKLYLTVILLISARQVGEGFVKGQLTEAPGKGLARDFGVNACFRSLGP